MSYRTNIGQFVQIVLMGSNIGDIWGTTIYTDDSPIAVAAVHSGFVLVGQVCDVRFQILGPQNRFDGARRNGITSLSYGYWLGSYIILGATCEDG